MFIGFVGSLVAVAGVGYAMVVVPNVAAAAKSQNNIFEWSNGQVMVATGGEVNRQNLNYSKIPEKMRYAVISQENKTFETDSGVDPSGIGRAIFNMARGGETQGGSTITQQYVKNAMLNDQSQTISRKFKEIFVAIKVGATVPKDEVMAGYLNTAYFGRGAYGIQAASRAYFNKDAIHLNPGECAFLAALVKGATYYDPAGATYLDTNATATNNSRRALLQMQDTLDKMVEYGHLSAAERDKYRTLPPIKSPRSNTRLSGQIGYLVDLAKSYIVHNTNITALDLQQGGYTIRTTFDKKKVDALEKAVEKVRSAKIKPDQRPEDKYVQFGGASVNPSSGAIEAVYGGEDATKHFTDNADATGAQVGSTFKPFVLAAAMKWGVLNPKMGADQPNEARTVASPKSIYIGKNKLKIRKYDGTVWTDDKGREWLQTNDDNASVGPKPDYKIDLREAMRQSVNTAYVQLGMDVGLDKVKQSALDAGILKGSLASADYPSFSIGTSDPSAIRMAGAYATFAASGQQNEPFSVRQVKDQDGVAYTHEDRPRDGYSKAVADNVTDVLRTVVEKGTGTKAQLPNREVAGKTGTTDGNKSAWFVGYTPQLSTAVCMFRMDDNAKNKNRKFLEMYNTGGQEKIHGASFPAEIWHDYMAQALQGQPVMNFPPPAPIGTVVNAEPSPTPTPTVAETQTSSPSPSASPTESASPTPTATETCRAWDWNCDQTGGTDTGGAADGGVTPTPTVTDTSGTGTRGGGNGGADGTNGDGGGFFGGTKN